MDFQRFRLMTKMKQLILLMFLCIFYSGVVFAETIVSQPDVRKYNLGLGKSVFSGMCINCHGDINSEAPQLNSVYDWERRISTPLTELIKHAVSGHGKMPPKGGFENLSEREVSAAVAFIVDQSRRLIISTNGNIALNQDDICVNTDNEACTGSQVDNTMLLNLIWLMTNKSQEQ